MKCAHQRAYVSDARATDSDTVIITTYCPECPAIWRDEEVGSLARAIAQEMMDAEDDAESKRPIFYGDAA